VTSQSNYQVSANGKTGTLLPPGAMIDRDFKNNEFEYYAQDSWRISPNLTVNTDCGTPCCRLPTKSMASRCNPPPISTSGLKPAGRKPR